MTTIDNQALAWVVRQSARQLGEEEQAAFDAWYAADIRHQGAYFRAGAIQTALERASEQQTARPRREWLLTEWQGDVPTELPPRRSFLKQGWRYGGALAACALMAALFAPLQPEPLMLAAAKGELRVVPLADSSVASINSGSRIEVSMRDDARDIALQQGDAFFQVAKDKTRPFVVAAGEARVRAVGTAFGVRRLSHGAEIVVTEGTVEVWSAGRKALPRRVTAGHTVLVSEPDDTILVRQAPAEAEQKLAWRQGKLVFVDQKLSEAVADFNRYSKRQIVIVDPALNDQGFVGQYPVDAAEMFARDVSAYLKVPLVITADKILIGAVRKDQDSHRRPAPVRA